MSKTNKPKQHGGHQTGFRADISKGSGPVFEVRKGLDVIDKAAGGIGYSQARMANLIGCSPRALWGYERDGRWPHGKAVRANLNRQAALAGIDLSRWKTRR